MVGIIIIIAVAFDPHAHHKSNFHFNVRYLLSSTEWVVRHLPSVKRRKSKNRCSQNDCVCVEIIISRFGSNIQFYEEISAGLYIESQSIFSTHSGDFFGFESIAENLSFAAVAVAVAVSFHALDKLIIVRLVEKALCVHHTAQCSCTTPNMIKSTWTQWHFVHEQQKQTRTKRIAEHRTRHWKKKQRKE